MLVRLVLESLGGKSKKVTELDMLDLVSPKSPIGWGVLPVQDPPKWTSSTHIYNPQLTTRRSMVCVVIFLFRITLKNGGLKKVEIKTNESSGTVME